MEFDNTFIVAAPIEEVWRTMLDVERVAPCLPGAQVTEKTGEDAFTFTMKVKLGTTTITYKGDLQVVEHDEIARRATMRVEAKEARGQGTADGAIYLRVIPAGEQAQADIHAEVTVSGRAAAMGEDVIGDVSARLTNTFADNLAAMLAAPWPETAEAPVVLGTGEASPTNGGPALPSVTPEPIIPAPEPSIAAPDLTAAAPDPTMPVLDPTPIAPDPIAPTLDPAPAAPDPIAPTLDPAPAAPDAITPTLDPARALDPTSSPPDPTYAVPYPASPPANEGLMTVLAGRMRDPRTAISVLAGAAVLVALGRRRR